MSRNLRTFSSLSRSILKSRTNPPYPANGVVKIQRVRFIRPFFTKRRLQTVLLWSTAFTVYSSVIGSVEDEEDQEQSSGQIEAAEFEGQEAEEVGDEMGAPDEMSEEAWFIPLWFARERPRTFYKGTDPEWASFVKFAEDKDRDQYVRNELAGLVGNHMMQIKTFQKVLGTPITIVKYWLDVDFPEGPPPQYERTGLEIADRIHYTVREVDPVNLERLQRILWPRPLLTSFWASYSSLWSLRLAKIKNFFNIKEDDIPSRISPLNVDFRQPGQAADKNSPPKSTGQEARPGSETKTVSTPNQLPSPVGSERTEDSGTNRILRPLKAVPQPGGEMDSILTTFKKTLRSAWRPSLPPHPPRGTILISGLVELSGPKAICLLDVLGTYHPGESRWVSIGTRVRRLQRRVQRPRGDLL